MTKIFAHRGSKGTHPENTLAAFQRSVELGVDGIELDVHLTKDQQLVVIHDERLERTTNGTGFIYEYTLAELKQLDASSWFSIYDDVQRIPTLQEVITLCNRLGFTGIVNVEVKTDQIHYPLIEERLVELLQQKKTFIPMYSSFNLLTLERLYELDKTTNKAWIMEGTASTVDFASYFQAIDSIHPNFEWVIKAQEELFEFTKLIRPWTVNQESEMWMCFEKQFEAFHTDYPEKALAIKERYQQSRLVTQ